MRNPSCLTLLPLLVLTALAGPVRDARAEPPKTPTLAVLPLQVFNAPDLAPAAPGLQAALASRLALPGYRVLTLAAGEATEADWSLRTTVTRLGTRLTVDAALEPKGGAEPARRAFQTADTVDGLLPALEALASTLREGLVAPTARSQLPAPPGPAAAAPTPTPAGPTPAAPAQPGGAGLAQAFARYRLSAVLPGEAHSLVVADVDRDGTPEILALVDERIVALRDDGREPKVLWEFPLPPSLSPALLSAGDVDGDGAPELFVAGLRGKDPVTQAYQWAGSALAPHGREFNAFARAVVHPERGVLLLGMTSGVGSDLFGATQRSFAWDGGAYRPKEAFPVPYGVSVIDLDWCRAPGSGAPVLVAMTQTGELRLYDAAGKKLFESSDTFKGTRNLLVGTERSGGDADTFHVEGKTLTWTADDGTSHLILHKNYGTLARLFRQWASFTHGQFLAYRWDGVTLLPTAEGPKVPGFFADLDLGPTPGQPARRTLYTTLVQSEGMVSVTYTTRLMAVDL